MLATGSLSCPHRRTLSFSSRYPAGSYGTTAQAVAGFELVRVESKGVRVRQTSLPRQASRRRRAV